MGLIKEPLDVDFYVEHELLSDEERALISQYILLYKTKSKRKQKLSNLLIKNNEVKSQPNI